MSVADNEWMSSLSAELTIDLVIVSAAALDLYREHGYDRTTTARIDERAGVTELTCVRHFRDMRERAE